MAKFKIEIYDEFIGDLDIAVDCINANPADVRYDHSLVELALQTADGSIPPHIDADIRGRAVDSWEESKGGKR